SSSCSSCFVKSSTTASFTGGAAWLPLPRHGHGNGRSERESRRHKKQASSQNCTVNNSQPAILKSSRLPTCFQTDDIEFRASNDANREHMPARNRPLREGRNLGKHSGCYP